MSWIENNKFFVKEHVGMFKAANNYDIFTLNEDGPGEELLECREPKLGFFTKLLRFTDYKRMTPFHVVIKDKQGNIVVQVKRGVSLWLSKVEVLDGNGTYIGGFKQKFGFRPRFSVLDKNEQEACILKGKFAGWDFKFLSGEKELAHVSKKWAGMAKEMFTSADNYILTISEEVPGDSNLKKLIIAAVMCIDMVIKE